jgi:hypothetical protein
MHTLKERNRRIRIDGVKSMVFDKLDRLMPNTVDFTDSDIDSTHLYYFVRKKADRDSNPRPLDPITA